MIRVTGAGAAMALASCASTGGGTAGAPAGGAYPGGSGWSQTDADYVQVTPTGQTGGGGYAAGGAQTNPYGAYQGGSGGGYTDYSSYSQGGGGGAAAAPNYGSAPSAPAPTYAPPASGRTYTVQKGDNLFRISRSHGTSVEALMAANNMATTNIFPGDVLRIP